MFLFCLILYNTTKQGKVLTGEVEKVEGESYVAKRRTSRRGARRLRPDKPGLCRPKCEAKYRKAGEKEESVIRL